jgi:CRISPR-associated protein Cmr1
MRTIPKKSPDGKIAPFLAKDENNNLVSKDSQGNVTLHIERKYELITPLFGGGVEAKKNDDITLISGKTIRGHLRFWWRATRGGQFGGGTEGLKRMKEREAEIWGAASTPDKLSPSRVQIEVYNISKKDIEYPYRSKSKPS